MIVSFIRIKTHKIGIFCVLRVFHISYQSMCPPQKAHPRSKEVDMAELEIDVDNVSDPEPSSPRRTNTTTANSSMTTTATRGKQEVALTSSGGSNASTCSHNKNYKNHHYQLTNINIFYGKKKWILLIDYSIESCLKEIQDKVVDLQYIQLSSFIEPSKWKNSTVSGLHRIPPTARTESLWWWP